MTRILAHCLVLGMLCTGAVCAEGVDWPSHYDKICAAKAPTARFFPDAAKKATTIRWRVCQVQNGPPSTEITEKYKEGMLALLGELVSAFPDATDSGFAARAHSAVKASIKDNGRIPNWNDNLVNQLPRRITLSDDVDVPSEDCDRFAKSSGVKDASCVEVIREFGEIYNYAQGSLAGLAASVVHANLVTLESEWDRYFSESRSQTLLELLVNGKRFQQTDKESRFSPPPSTQWILLHPSLVIENVSKSVSGHKTQEALMLEIFGMDWWQQDKWYVPSGGSVIALYSDRPEVKDWGYGVALHFRSKFTLGVARHGGSTGAFVSIDLLKLLQTKASTFEHYRGLLDP